VCCKMCGNCVVKWGVLIKKFSFIPFFVFPAEELSSKTIFDLLLRVLLINRIKGPKNGCIIENIRRFRSAMYGAAALLPG